MRRTCRHGSKWNNYIENAVDRNRDARFLGCFFALKNLSMPRNQHVLEFLGSVCSTLASGPFGVLYEYVYPLKPAVNGVKPPSWTCTQSIKHTEAPHPSLSS